MSVRRRAPLTALFLPLALTTALATGCGEKSEDGGGSEGDQATPAQVEDAGQLAMIRAHQTASLRLYEMGQAARAEKHAGHPAEEIFFSLSRTLRSRDAALTAELRASLKESNDLVREGAPEAELKASLEEGWELLERAEASLVPDSVRESPAFRARVIADLLEKVEEEYAEAYGAGGIENEIEYQDAWGALDVAGDELAAARSDFGGEADEIEEQLDDLRAALPGVEPPARAASTETIEQAVDGAVAELNVVAGVETAGRDPVAELGEVRALLTDARTAYDEGKRDEAQELVSEAYLEHFEKVEPALLERDRDLMESLEVLISTELRNAIKAGAPRAKVNALTRQALAGLDQAERVLQEGKAS